MKQKTVFLCGDCGYESPKWYGKCPSCGAWNTMSEFKEKPVSAARGTNTFQRGESRPTLLKDIDTGDESRFHSGIGELDRVLGGGAVHGSFVLVGGEPGIGKSTLLLQMCQEMCKKCPRALCFGRGIAQADQNSCGTPAHFFTRAVHPCRDRHGADHQRNRAARAGYSNRGLYPDGL